jgi:acetolactate decarboxylase
MPELYTVVPASLSSALHAEVRRTGETTSSVVTAALAEYLGTPIHTLFRFPPPAPWLPESTPAS